MEVDTKEQLQALLTLPDGTIDFILCDNFGPEALAEVHEIRTYSVFCFRQSVYTILCDNFGPEALAEVHVICTSAIQYGGMCRR